MGNTKESELQDVPYDPRLKRMAFRRAIARNLDGLLLYLPLASLFMTFLPGWIGGMLAMAGWVLMEAACIWRFHATPGKALMGLRVISTGDPLTLETAVKRSLLVWVLGEAMEFVLLLHVAMAQAAKRFVTTGRTKWDDKCGTDVVSTWPFASA